MFRTGNRFFCNICLCFGCVLFSVGFCFGLAAFVFWLIFLPQEPKFTITNASLAQFNFTNTNNNTLSYNLSFDITIRNSNKRVGIYYRRIQVIANYRKKRFALVTLASTPFYQGHKNTTILHHVLVEGQQLVDFGKREISMFNSETTAGVYSIQVQLALQVKVRYGKFKTGNYKPERKIDCRMMVPLSFNETSVSSFKATKCGDVYFFSNPDHVD